MSQRMPVIRQLEWAALIPQCAAIVVLTVIIHPALPNLILPADICIAAVVYGIFCRVMRAKFARDHKQGMRAYHAQKFQEAIANFEASYEFFSAHRKMDAWRSLLFGVAGPNPYRIIALCNMAYCYSQLGNGQQAIKLYEKTLQDEPDCAIARSSLNMLRSVAPASNAGPSA